jgi:alanine racemase
MNLTRPTFAEIDLVATRHNIKRICEIVGPRVKVLSMVKAEAYGHGMRAIAQTAIEAGASALGFATLSEALMLKNNQHSERSIDLFEFDAQSKDAASSKISPITAPSTTQRDQGKDDDSTHSRRSAHAMSQPEAGWRARRDASFTSVPLMVLGWTPDWLAESAIKNDIICTVFDLDTAAAFARTAQSIGEVAHVHIKVDTGMGRLGFMPDEAPDAIAQIRSMAGIEIDGVFTHFAKADEADRSYTLGQIEKFKRVIEQVEAKGIEIPIKHACNSPGILRYPEAHFDMVRPGIIQHGLDPSDDVPCPMDFKPVMTLKTMIASVKTLPPGSRVSYGGTYITQDYEKIAVLPIGYADGFRRKPNNWGEVLVHGRRAKIVGRVCMDQAMINVSHIDDVKQGDEVVLIGDQSGEQGDDRIRAEDVARQLDTNNYEVTSMVMARVPRIYRE